MKRPISSVLLPVVLVAFVACSEGDVVESLESETRQIISDSSLPDGLDAESFESLKRAISSLHDEVRAADFDASKRKATTLDTYISVRIWRWYSSVLEAKKEGGTEAALERVEILQARSDIEYHERDALNEIAEKLKQGEKKSGSDIFWTVLLHSLRPRYGDYGALAIMTAIAAAQLAGRV